MILAHITRAEWTDLSSLCLFEQQMNYYYLFLKAKKLIDVENEYFFMSKNTVF